MKLNPKFLLLALGLFFVEVFLALFVRDPFFRPIMGDVLVVVLIYAFLRSFWANTSKALVWGVCVFAYTVEFIQYFDPIGYFGLQDYRVLSIVVGRTFTWVDLVAYTVGTLVNLKLRHISSVED